MLDVTRDGRVIETKGGPGLSASQAALLEDEIVWSDDVEVKLDVGDRVHGLLEVVVERPENPRAWVAGISALEVETLWNRELERRGETTRISVTACRVSRSFLTGSAGTYGVEIEVIGVVTHNSPLLAWALVAVLVAAIVGFAADGYLNGAKVSGATGKAIGTLVGSAVDAAGRPITDLAWSLAAAAALLLGVYLWAR